MKPATAFDGARAFQDVRAIARAPHPVGSAEHAAVREHLVAELRGFGLDVRVQEGVGVLPLDYDGVVPVGRVGNIVAERKGTAPTGRLVLAAHYDSVPGAPGAADDGAGVATLLEVARNLPKQVRNDVTFLITDGEEQGLLGASAVPRDGLTVVLNNEARGNRGAVMMFRTSRGSGPLLDLYGSAAPHPAADSGFAALLEVLPNNTDFYVFARDGWLGLDSAFTGGGAYYHTPLDDPAHLDRASLQQMGDNTLAVAGALAGADLAAMRGGERIYFTVPWLLVRYPAWLELPIAIGALVLAVALVWLLRRRGEVRLPRVAAGAGVGLVAVLVAAVAGYFYWPLLGVVRPEYAAMFTGDPYRPWLYQGALLLVVVAVVLAARRVVPGPALAAGGLVLVALLGVCFAVLLPGGSHTLAVPALFAAAGGLAALRFRGPWVTVGLVPGAVIMGGNVVAGFDVGLKLGGVIAGLYLGLLLLLVLPLVTVRRVPLVAAVAAVALTGAGLVVDRFDAEHPVQSHLEYSVDTATGKAVWGEPGQSADSVRYFGEDGYATRPAPFAPLKAPRVTEVRPGVLRIVPEGDAPVVGLSLGTAVPISVDGRALGTRKGISYYAPPREGIEVTLDLPAKPTQVRIFQQTYELPGLRPAPDTIYLRPTATAFSVRQIVGAGR